MKKRWDIFCRVIDNFGDIGVCWRLARQLAMEHGLSVHLWVDDLAPFPRLRPGIDPARDRQMADGVTIVHWTDAPRHCEDVADVVIEAFACELPAAYLEAMARRPVAPVWINLEYLSAEDWGAGCHGLASPHPRLPLTKHFFFPGFVSGTGGLLREQDYTARRAVFDPAACRAGLGLADPVADALVVSLFGYENPALDSLLAAWTAHPLPIHLLVPESRLLPQVRRFFDIGDAAPGACFKQGQLVVEVVPFLPQPDYDKLLWLCDLNFVRGEDSFVRAQWAEKPFVWHIYPQADKHHQVKLAAFLDRYLAGHQTEAWAMALQRFWWAWEQGEDAGAAWPDFRAALPTLHVHGQTWARQLQNNGDLVGNLLSFVMKSM